MSEAQMRNSTFVELSSDAIPGGGPFVIHGLALGEDDITEDIHGHRFKWTSGALEDAASTLVGKPIVKNHINRDIDAVIGTVTKAGYKKKEGVVFEGEVDDVELAEKISRGRFETSPRIFHEPVDEMDKEDGVFIVHHIEEFANLSIVVRGASSSQYVTDGEHSDLSLSELQAYFEYDTTSPQSSQEGPEDDVGTSGGNGSDDTGTTTELQETAPHRPSFSGTTTGDWSAPDLEDFGTDDLSVVDNHFVVSSTGFPPDNFTDLSLPVVTPDGELSLPALRNAKARASQVSGLSGEALSRAKGIINSLAEKNFDGVDFSENEKKDSVGNEETDPEESNVGDEEPSVDYDRIPVYTADDMDDWVASTDNEYRIMSAEEDIAALSARIEAAGTDPEDLALVEKEEYEQKLSELADLTDEVVGLRDYKESTDEEIEAVKDVYASVLSDNMGIEAEVLKEKFEIMELRETYESKLESEDIGEFTGSSPNPRSGDSFEDEEDDESDLSEAEQEQVELLESQLREYRKMNWDRAANRVESELAEFRPEEK